MDQLPEQISQMRRFNRFYTRLLGAWNKRFLKSDYSLGESRLIYELAQRPNRSARRLAEAMSIDAGQMSRMVKRLIKAEIVDSRADETDRRTHLLTLTAKGEAAAEFLAKASNDNVGTVLDRLTPIDRETLVASTNRVEALLSDVPAAPPILRAHRVGDLGWLIHRQGILYNRQFGWNIEFEALIARLYGEYEAHLDHDRKALWIAEWKGEIVGSVYVVPNADDPTMAQLRMLYVEPFARGQGIGSLLVDQAVSFARASSYRGIMLWTQDCLTSARRIYIHAGFRLEREDRHHSFGVDLNGQFWTQDF